MTTITRLRPAFPYFGGKQHLTPFLMRHLPSRHDQYLEPYFGAGTLLWQLPPARIETVNDLDGDLITFYRVLRDPEGLRELQRLCLLTPWSRAEYRDSLELVKSGGIPDPVELAWRWLIVARFSFGGKWGHGVNMGPGRSCKTSTMNPMIARLVGLHLRLHRVQIECEDAVKVIRRYGVPGTFIYADPPYQLETRSGGAAYRHEMTDAQHEALVQALLETPALVMLSGYNNPIYVELERRGWQRIDRVSNSGNHRGVLRVESIWINYEADALRARSDQEHLVDRRAAAAPIGPIEGVIEAGDPAEAAD